MDRVVAAHLMELQELCRKHSVRRLDIFGSAATGDFDAEESDLDFVVEFLPVVRRGFKDVYFTLLDDLETLFNRRVDLVEASAIRNPYFRQSIEETRVPLYAAA
jgi:uncharacterized protein